MNIRKRLERLEASERRLAHNNDNFVNGDTYIAEKPRLARWLAERGWTAEAALARGERGPGGAAILHVREHG